MADGYGMQDYGCGLAVASTDYDRDGDPDVLVTNDFGAWVFPDRLFQNQYPNLQMVELGAASGADNAIYGMGIAIGDYDNDLDLDYYYSNLGRNVLLENQGDGTFIDVATPANVENTDYMIDPFTTRLVTSWGTAFFDYDHDTYVDLYVCNGYVPAAEFIATTNFDPNKLYRNQGDGTFVDEAANLGVDDGNVGRGFAIGDYDNDGDMDMIVVNVNEFVTGNALVRLYRNDLDGQANWFKVYLEGVQSNRDAYGAQVELHAGGQTFLREIDGGSSHASAHESVAHFGLADLDYVDSITVYWPGGFRESFCGYDVNQSIQLLEGSGQSNCSVTSIESNMPANLMARLFPNPSPGELNVELVLTNTDELFIELYDVQGKQLGQWTIGTPSAGRQIIPLATPELATGVYQIRVTQNGQAFNLRWLVMGR
ncbi:MAG: FG-GAP-like repeat-containing protein [Bacteroidota bacterium]